MGLDMNPAAHVLRNVIQSPPRVGLVRMRSWKNPFTRKQPMIDINGRIIPLTPAQAMTVGILRAKRVNIAEFLNRVHTANEARKINAITPNADEKTDAETSANAYFEREMNRLMETSDVLSRVNVSLIDFLKLGLFTVVGQAIGYATISAWNKLIIKPRLVEILHLTKKMALDPKGIGMMIGMGLGVVTMVLAKLASEIAKDREIMKTISTPDGILVGLAEMANEKK
jgi:hypothetical protein